MKKLFAIILISLCFFCVGNSNFSFTSAESNTNKYVVTANSAVLYELPNFTSTKLFTISRGTEVTIVLENDAPRTFTYQNYVFYKISSYQNTDGYIFSDLLTPKVDVLNVIPDYNAQTNALSKVFWKENNLMAESGITLSRHTKIFLYEGYNHKLEYTAISFEYENQVYYGYISTKCVDPDGINPTILVCFTIILALLGIIFSWVFMKNKKIKVKKRIRIKEKKLT